MKKNWKSISPRLRKKILEESRASRGALSELANRYGIRKERIYRWREQDSRKTTSYIAKNDTRNNFVEAKLEENVEGKTKLKKASLEFTDFTLSIEGSLNVNQVSQILEVLC